MSAQTYAISSVKPGPGPGAVSEYVGIIRQEVQRCTHVLDQLSGRAASASAADRGLTLAQLVGDLRARLGESLSRRLDVSLPDAPPRDRSGTTSSLPAMPR